MDDYMIYIKYFVIAILLIAVIFYVKDKIELFLYQRYLHKFGSLQDYRVNHPKLIQANGDVICYKCKNEQTIRVTHFRQCSRCNTILFHIDDDK